MFTLRYLVTFIYIITPESEIDVILQQIVKQKTVLLGILKKRSYVRKKNIEQVYYVS